MSGRQFRKVLLILVVAGVAYWIYKDQPSLSGFIDSITNPLMGSHAAVKSSERNRVVGEASAVISEQSEVPVAGLREGMTIAEVLDLLGQPNSRETETVEGVQQLRFEYRQVRRVIVFQNGRVVSIVIR